MRGDERVRVVDTIGAGAAFMAGLLSGLLRAGLLGGAGSIPGRCARPSAPGRSSDGWASPTSGAARSAPPCGRRSSRGRRGHRTPGADDGT
ncbi:hypothetical protein GTY85_10030 [Streptomyces sp. SID8377]|nr:hypothetical protein [Streptomyces sp. SID8377]